MKNQEDIILNLLNKYKIAAETKDVELMLSLYSAEIHVFDCFSDWELIGIDKYKEMIVDWFNSLNEEKLHLIVSFSDFSIEMDERIAFAHCNILFEAYNEDNRKIRFITNRFTFNIKRHESQWLIVHQHSSLPINPENGKMMTKK